MRHQNSSKEEAIDHVQRNSLHPSGSGNIVVSVHSLCLHDTGRQAGGDEQQAINY